MDYLIQLRTLSIIFIISLFYQVIGQLYNSENISVLRNRHSYQDFRDTPIDQGYRLTHSNQRNRQTHKRPRQTQTNQGYSWTQSRQTPRGSVSTNDYGASGRSQSDFPYRRPINIPSSQTRRPFSSILHSIYENSMPGMEALTTTIAPGMSVGEMESILRRMPKDINNSAHPGYVMIGMMMQILTEECRRLLNSRSSRMREFCLQPNSNFPTS